uniref:GIY-YIG domain-containing protein n=1 Tax=Aegilops tauschii subsp. strangulata TaxID=200361 RepID=A0A453HQQ9_AEGTS
MSLSATFRVAKIPRTTLPPKSCKATPSSVSASPAPASGDPPPKAAKKKKEAAPWCVYLIASSLAPRTYVGVTTDFPRRWFLLPLSPFGFLLFSLI